VLRLHLDLSGKGITGTLLGAVAFDRKGVQLTAGTLTGINSWNHFEFETDDSSGLAAVRCRQAAHIGSGHRVAFEEAMLKLTGVQTPDSFTGATFRSCAQILQDRRHLARQIQESTYGRLQPRAVAPVHRDELMKAVAPGEPSYPVIWFMFTCSASHV
jgi:hypothetical protein